MSTPDIGPLDMVAIERPRRTQLRGADATASVAALGARNRACASAAFSHLHHPDHIQCPWGTG